MAIALYYKLDGLSEDEGNYFFRGEPIIYYERVIASANRPYNSLFNKGDVYIDYKDLIKEYYLEIANNLSEIDRINIMHYAQHHGMPTP